MHAHIVDSFSIGATKSFYSIRLMSVHKRIREGRAAIGMTVTQFADAIGVTRAAVNQWEREGGTAPARNKQARVAKLLNMSVSELMSPGLEPSETRPAPEGYSTEGLALAWLLDQIPDRLARTRAAHAATEAVLLALQSGARPIHREDHPVNPEKRHA